MLYLTVKLKHKQRLIVKYNFREDNNKIQLWKIR